MAIVADDVIRVTYWQSLFNQKMMTVLHFRCALAPGVGNTFDNLTQLAILLGGAAQPLVTTRLPISGADWKLDRVTAQRVWPTRSMYAEEVIDEPGTNGSPTEASNVALSIEKRSSRAGRRGIGRVALAGLPTAAMENGNWSAAELLLAEAYADELLEQQAPIDGSNYVPILWGAGAPTDDDQLIDWATFAAIRVMRRRTLHVGI